MAKRLKADERQERIVAAARKLFAKQGYEATRVEEIAEVAGCTTGPVYHFFGTKKEIFEAALRAGIRDAAGSMEVVRADQAEASPMNRLMRSCDHLLGLLSIKETTSFALEAPRVLGFDRYRESFYGSMVPFIEADLRAAMIAGEVDPEPPEPLAVIIAGAIISSAHHIALARPGSSAEELARFQSSLQRMLTRLRVA